MCTTLGHECNCFRERHNPEPIHIPYINSYLSHPKAGRMVNHWHSDKRVDLPNNNRGLLNLILPADDIPNYWVSYNRLRGQGKYDGPPAWYYGRHSLNGN